MSARIDCCSATAAEIQIRQGVVDCPRAINRHHTVAGEVGRIDGAADRQSAWAGDGTVRPSQRLTGVVGKLTAVREIHHGCRASLIYCCASRGGYCRHYSVCARVMGPVPLSDPLRNVPLTNKELAVDVMA